MSNSANKCFLPTCQRRARLKLGYVTGEAEEVKKRRQHYVWRKYLEPWCDGGKVWCHRKGTSPFHTNPINVAVERDFYKLTKLTKNDVVFVNKIAIEPINHAALRKLNAGWISLFETIFKLEEGLRGNQWLNPELIPKIDEVMHNLDEDHNTALENISANYLDSLIKGDASFYKDDVFATEFTYFMASQYFRTKNIRDSFFTNFSSRTPEGVSIERTWPIIRYIFSTCVGFNLYANRDQYKLVILNNDTDAYFVTSDQPVQNVYAAGLLGKKSTDEVELFYPVSPNRAVLISNDTQYADKQEQVIGSSTVSYYNNIVAKGAYEQIFTKTMDCLTFN